MNTAFKNILIAGALCVIVWLFILLIIYAVALVIVLSVIGLAIFGLYILWEKYVKYELMKKEENFEILRSDNEKSHHE